MSIYFLFIFLLQQQVQAVQLRTEGELRIKKEASTDYNLVKAGETIEINKGETLLAVPTYGLPFFIMIPLSGDSTVQLSSGDVSSMAQTQIADTVGKTVHEVITGLRKAETFMGKKEYDQGLNILRPLKEKYPQVAEVFFLSGSLNFLSKNKNAAIEDLKKGLSITPDEASAQKLLVDLQGSSL